MFTKPVYLEDEITVKGRVVEIFESVRQVAIRVDVYNQNNEKVLRGRLKAGVIDE